MPFPQFKAVLHFTDDIGFPLKSPFMLLMVRKTQFLQWDVSR
jgi:hypothetical protein